MRGPRRGKLTVSGGCGVSVRDRAALRGDRSVPAAQDGSYRVVGGGFRHSRKAERSPSRGLAEAGCGHGCGNLRCRLDARSALTESMTLSRVRFHEFCLQETCPVRDQQGGGKKSRAIGSSWVLGSSRGRLATARSTLAGFAINSRLTARPASRRPTTSMTSRKTG